MSTGAAANVDWGDCLTPAVAAPPALAAEVRAVMGVVPGWLKHVGATPWLARAFARLAAKPVRHIRPELADLVGLVVSQDNSCRYCYGIQRAIFKVFGYPDERLDRLERDLHVADLAPAERKALDFARKISRANPRPGAGDVEALRAAGFTAPAVAEIAFIAAAASIMNRAATLLALPPDPFESMVRRPIFRLVRPFVARQMRRHTPPALPPPPRPDPGPCAGIVGALGDVPAAGVLRAVIDEAWASPVLPRRTKALALGVVGKALDCPASESEARAFATAEGVSAADVDEVFATLGAPSLDARERLIVPFARETVRYQVGPIQRRTAELAARLEPAELLEAVGVVSLANGVCRLSVLLDAC